MSQTNAMLDRHIAYELYEHIPTDGLEYTYRGNVNSDVVENILSLAETNFGDMKEKVLVRKRVYFIMVESLQNITRHQEIDADSSFDQYGLFIIRRGKFGYYITSANLVKNENCAKLQERIDIINSKDSEELKMFSREVLTNGKYSTKGGAGLGLIEMARKSGNKLKYSFVPTKYGYTRFYMHIDILFNKKDIDNQDALAEIKQYSLDKIFGFHLGLQKYHIFLHYSGILNQENLINLMNILSRQINVSKALKTRVYCVMIELLQNILLHADRLSDEKQTHCFGMFFIRQDNEHLVLTAANHVLNSKIPNLISIIDSLNAIDRDERIRMAKSPGNNSKGIISMLNKSRHNAEYNFTDIGGNYSLFSISVFLDKDQNVDMKL